MEEKTFVEDIGEIYNTDVNEFEWDRIDYKYGNKLFTDGKVDTI